MTEVMTENSHAHEGANLLIVDDDQPWLTRLGRAMESRGYVVH
ncbi:MAG: two-component system response regulator, partial [PS1 clade bacterium]|nr:two-component system response regulator [PS1 clade bacterium]